MDELHRLSIVSKVTTELENHVGVSDKDLAEFVISIAAKSATPPAFHAALLANGAEFPDSFTTNLFNIISSHAGAARASASGNAATSSRSKKRKSAIGAHQRRRFG
jgi:ATP-dependent RNA helicase DHX8/PRP22